MIEEHLKQWSLNFLPNFMAKNYKSGTEKLLSA
jgi:hypothetical protein